MDSFFEEVYSIVARIPCGRVMSYGQIAKVLDRPRSARMVGWAMRRCPEGLPWHRVIKGDGSIASGILPDLGRQLLMEEGVTFLDDGRVDMEQSRWEYCPPEAQQDTWMEQL